LSEALAVITLPGEIPTNTIPALAHVGKIPGLVVKAKVPVASTVRGSTVLVSVAFAAGVPRESDISPVTSTAVRILRIRAPLDYFHHTAFVVIRQVKL
jgi:hypothetical protein